MDEYERINMLKRELKKFIPLKRPTYEDLALKDEDGKTLFEFIIDNQIESHKILKLMEDITNNYDYLFYMISHDYFPSEYYNYDLLLDSSKGTPIILLLFEKQKYDVVALPQKVLKELFVKRDGKYLIEDLIKMDKMDCWEIIKKIDDLPLLIKCLRDINQLELLKYAEKCMTQKLPNGKTLLEILNDANSTLAYIDYNSIECAEILYNIGNYDRLARFTPEVLVNYPSKDNNYLNILINKYKDGEKISFDNLNYFSIDYKNMAIVLITLEKNNIPFKKPQASIFVPMIADENKPLIIHMLEIDRDLTMNNFITDEIIKEFREYIKKIVPKEQKDSIDNLTFEEMLSFLPSKEKLLEEIKNGKKSINDTDYYSDDYLKPFGGEKTFLEYALKNKINIKGYTPNTIEAVMLFLKYKGYISGGIKEKLLYEKLDTGELLIDYLMNNHYERLVADSVKDDKRIFEYCEKYENYTIIRNSNLMKDLFVVINGSCDAEKYLDNDNFIKAMRYVKLGDRHAVDLFNKGYLKALTHVTEHILLKKIDGKTILQSLLENNIEPSFCGYDFEQVETIRLLYLYKKPHLMWNAKTSLLVNKPTKENNYLQYMINSYKQGIEVHFADKDFFFQTNNKDIARCYIQMAKNGLLDLLDDLTEDKLLYTANGDNNHLLANLIEIDRDTTINKILSVSLLKKPRINAALKILSRDGLINLPYERLDADEICRKKMNETYAEGLVCPCEDLLAELRELFVNDPETDIRLVDALITSYRYATAVNPIFIEELKVLIEIKKKNPDFHYKRIDSSAYFDGESVCCDDATIGTLVHETGHAIHHYTTNEEVPQGFYELMERIRNSPEWIQKVANYSQKFHEIRKKIHERAAGIVKNVFDAHLTDEDEKEIDRLLTEEKERIKNEYIKKGYSEADLDVILSDTFTREQFLAQKVTIETGEVEDFLLRHLYDAFISIGDFIDGITYGKFRSKVLRDEDGEFIPATYGHGVRYYKTHYLIFCEMVANYSEIIKSKHSKEILNLLRHIVGDELVDMLDDFYRHRMLSLPQYEIESQDEIAGKSR